MKKYIIILTSIAFFSCKDETKSNMTTMQANFKIFFTDQAFKDNIKLNIMELKSFGYDTLNENYIDTIKILNAQEKFDHFNDLAKSALEIAQLKGQQLRLYASLGDNTLNDINREDLKKTLTEVNEYRDSMTKYIQLDSAIRERIAQRKLLENIYKAKFFIKAVASRDGKETNMLDTIYIHFDKNFNVINLKENY